MSERPGGWTVPGGEPEKRPGSPSGDDASEQGKAPQERGYSATSASGASGSQPDQQPGHPGQQDQQGTQPGWSQVPNPHEQQAQAGWGSPPPGWGQSSGQPGWSGQSGPGQPGQPTPPGSPEGQGWNAPNPGGLQGQQWGTPPGQNGWEGQQHSGWGGQPPGHSAQQPGNWGGQPPAEGWGGQPTGAQAQGGGWGNTSQQGGWGAPPQQGGWGSPAPGQPGWQRGMGRGAGIIPLRPLSIGEIYDGAIRAIRANPRTMVGFSAVVGAVLALAGTVPQAFALDTIYSSPLYTGETVERVETSDIAELLSASGLSALIAMVQSVLATTIITGLLIVAVGAAVRGETLSPGMLWQRARHRMWAVLGLALLLLVVAPVIIFLSMVPGGLLLFLMEGEVAVGGIVLVVGALLGAITYAAFYLGFWSVAAPALLLENLGVVAALRRSYRLVRGTFWRVFGISLLTAVIASVVQQIFAVPFGLVGLILAEVADFSGLSGAVVQLMISNIGTILAGAVAYPFTAGAVALLYLDLRMRREGMDVEVLRSEQSR